MSDDTQTHSEDMDDDIVFEPDSEATTETSFRGKTKDIKDEMKTIKSERQEYLDGWQRARAELVNLKKEHTDALAAIRSRTQIDMARDLLPVLDSFEMAMKNRDVWESVDATWRKGIEYISQQFEQVLADYGITKIDDDTAPFDPNIHEPIETIDADDTTADGTIATVIQSGYRTPQNIIRPAKVTVYHYKNN